jgi:hypothetical protein
VGTAYARVEMHKYINMSGIDCFYSDTDSLFINKELPKEHIGDKIGQFKNVLADSNYTKESDGDYFISKALF